MPEPITTRLLDLYRIGPGPSSSHTVGPMRAASLFAATLREEAACVARIRIRLLGSLSATGRGHATDAAVLAGLLGWDPATCDVDALRSLPGLLAARPRALWTGCAATVGPDVLEFVPFTLDHAALPHPNTMTCTAEDAAGRVLVEQTWCSVGGGFVREAGGMLGDVPAPPRLPLPHPFSDGASLLAEARRAGCGFGEIVLRNEAVREGGLDATLEGLDRVWEAFRAAIDRGLSRTGPLPGGLGLRRRAPELYERVRAGQVEAGYADIALGQAYALAVNEENAAGGRVVTAPTNGAAGILPGVLVEVADRYGLERDAIRRALATAGAVAMLIKTHASLSGAEVGCQGEIGSATSMAAAALCEILGGLPSQVEYAAEIGMEHNLGLTCDPLDGLVQAPCIERNAMGVAKAWSAAQLARHAHGAPLISLDRVLRVMKRTGEDMRREYKETSEGGLAVSLPEC